jgi:hypothetical protein
MGIVITCSMLELHLKAKVENIIAIVGFDFHNSKLGLKFG